MSTAMMILPKVWATASVSAAARAVNERKGPHSLRLVQAYAKPVAVPVVQVPLRVQPEMAFYRKYTEGMLRRYAKLSLESGRVPSLLGREMFRGNVTSCRVNAFDDVVIFVHDVANCMEKLGKGQQHLIRRIAVEEYTLGETAAMLGIPLRTVNRRYAEALDRLTRLFLDRELMHPLSSTVQDA